MSNRLEKLKDRAYKIGGDAIENYKDACSDLIRWPNLRKEILEDLERALDAHDLINMLLERRNDDR